MMSPSDKNPPPPTGKDETRKSSTTRDVKRCQGEQPTSPNCPRCDSANTKFCYYNNYSLAQPRHFCKSCKRYWTKGGALRNIPIGGACRKKNKNIINSKSSLSRNISSDHSIEHYSSSTTGLKFFQGLSCPTMDFQLGGGGGGGINLPINIHSSNKFSHNNFNPLSSSSSNPPCSNFNVETSAASLMGFGYQDMGSLSCIESLSSINQELHWKLQKQRLGPGMFFVGENHINYYNQKEALVQEQTQPINLFLENSNKSDESCRIGSSRIDGTGNGNLATEWFFDNSYDALQVNPTNLNIDDNYQNESIQAWRTHLTHQYTTALP